MILQTFIVYHINNAQFILIQSEGIIADIGVEQ